MRREKARLAEGTYPSRERAVIRFCRFLGEHGHDLMKLDGKALETYVAWLLSRLGCRDSRTGPTGKTLERDLTGVRQLLGWLVDTDRLVAAEVPEPLKRTRGESRPARGLTPEEVEAWFTLCDIEDVWGLRDRALFELTYGSGLRVGEVLALRTAELDLSLGAAQVAKSKNGEGRMVPLTERAAIWLKLYLERGRPELPMLRKHRDRLWCNSQGEPLTASTLYRRISVLYVPRLGFGERVSMHALRHSYATHLLRGGAEVEAVRRLLGHKRLASTALYTQVNLEDLRSTMEAHPRALVDEA